MEKILTIKEVYDEFNTSRKSQIRNAFCEHFEMSRDNFYKKINTNKFKKLENDFLRKQINIAVKGLNEVLKQS